MSLRQGLSRHKSSRQKAALRFIPRSPDSVPAPLLTMERGARILDYSNHLTDIDGNEAVGSFPVKFLPLYPKKEELVTSFP